jgi:hypothetical protein
MKTLICKKCNKEFVSNSKTNSDKYCYECKKIVSGENNIRHRDKKRREFFKDKIEGEDYVICKWCGKKTLRIYGKHIKYCHPGKTSNDYKNEFPGFPLSCKKDFENISKNSGKHMKEEKWRKWASEKMLGKKNINSRFITDEKTRKERSPFSKEFYVKRNLPDEQRAIFIKKVGDSIVHYTTLQYYTNKGYSEAEAKLLLKDRQTTFSLEKCIQKLGKEEGLKRWKERQEKWKEKVFNNEQWIGLGISYLTIEIIDNILLYNKDKTKLLHGKNEKFIYDKDLKRVYKYDLTNPINKKIIEINGTYWHCKPELYEPNYFNKVKKLFAYQIWEYDKRKIETAKLYGYDILIIWEDEYYLNSNKIIKKCVDFIYENYN